MKKFFNLFRKPSALSIAQTNLEEYERQLLVQEASAAYHEKLAAYYREGITRLKKQIK